MNIDLTETEKRRMGFDANGDLRVKRPDRFTHGSVTERLSARLDALEPVVERMVQNEAKLIADAVTMEAKIQAQHSHTLKLATEQRNYVDHEDAKLRQMQGVTFNSLAEFCGRSFWHRMRWLLTGR